MLIYKRKIAGNKTEIRNKNRMTTRKHQMLLIKTLMIIRLGWEAYSNYWRNLYWIITSEHKNLLINKYDMVMQQWSWLSFTLAGISLLLALKTFNKAKQVTTHPGCTFFIQTDLRSSCVPKCWPWTVTLDHKFNDCKNHKLLTLH